MTLAWAELSSRHLDLGFCQKPSIQLFLQVANKSVLKEVWLNFTNNRDSHIGLLMTHQYNGGQVLLPLWLLCWGFAEEFHILPSHEPKINAKHCIKLYTCIVIIKMSTLLQTLRPFLEIDRIFMANKEILGIGQILSHPSTSLASTT